MYASGLGPTFQQTYIDYKIMAILMSDLAQVSNVIITVVSWLVIIPWSVQIENGWDTPLKVYIQIKNIWIHTIPLIFTSLNMFLFSDVVVYYEDAWVFVPIALGYLVIAWTYTSLTGVALYPFLTFSEDNHDTLWFLLTMWTLTFSLHCFDAWAT